MGLLFIAFVPLFFGLCVDCSRKVVQHVDCSMLIRKKRACAVIWIKQRLPNWPFCLVLNVAEKKLYSPFCDVTRPVCRTHVCGAHVWHGALRQRPRQRRTWLRDLWMCRYLWRHICIIRIICQQQHSWIFDYAVNFSSESLLFAITDWSFRSTCCCSSWPKCSSRSQ